MSCLVALVIEKTFASYSSFISEKNVSYNDFTLLATNSEPYNIESTSLHKKACQFRFLWCIEAVRLQASQSHIGWIHRVAWGM